MRVIWKGDDPSQDLPTAMLEGSLGSVWTVVASMETQYLNQMPYVRQPVDVEVWFGSIGGASFDMSYELFSPAGVQPRVLYARVAMTMVTVTAADGRPTRIPATYRAAWADYVEEPVIITRRSRG